MSKSNRMLLPIVIILAVLLVYESDSDQQQAILSQIHPTQISTIQIIRKPLVDIYLQKKQNDWYLLTENSQLANTEMINKILAMLASETYQSFSLEGQDLNHYGLQQPQTRVIFNDLEIAFGQQEPLHSHRYVLIGQHIHLINNYYYYLLRSDISQFRNEKESTIHSPRG